MCGGLYLQSADTCPLTIISLFTVLSLSPWTNSENTKMQQEVFLQVNTTTRALQWMVTAGLEGNCLVENASAVLLFKHSYIQYYVFKIMAGQIDKYQFQNQTQFEVEQCIWAACLMSVCVWEQNSATRSAAVLQHSMQHWDRQTYQSRDRVMNRERLARPTAP